MNLHRPVGRTVARSSLKREGLRFKSRAGQMGHSVANGCCNISLKRAAVLTGRNFVLIIGPANSLHVSAYYSEYNERFDSDKLISSSRAGGDKDLLLFCKIILVTCLIHSYASTSINLISHFLKQ